MGGPNGSDSEEEFIKRRMDPYSVRIRSWCTSDS
jgi:hypothetical protein